MIRTKLGYRGCITKWWAQACTLNVLTLSWRSEKAIANEEKIAAIPENRTITTVRNTKQCHRDENKQVDTAQCKGRRRTGGNACELNPIPFVTSAAVHVIESFFLTTAK